MTSQNFIYFLQGFLELSNNKTITKEQLAKIKGHLKLVFRDDIDPSIGNKEHQKKLSDAHEEKLDLGDFFTSNSHLNPYENTFETFETFDFKERC